MSDTVITIENLSKRYLVGHQTTQRMRGRPNLRDVIARESRNFVRKAADVLRGRQIVQGDEVEPFWALKNVSFDVKQGDVVAIIGRNGAGKSTLLKILSRITDPTQGKILMRGRAASLLEVGTGFHPELTGRENIFLNGAILGMRQSEVRAKFDEIVAFAEVERFIDTPVKYYSSGMYVRLAFAVAAHLEPEILIVDEVLAVGDAEFQKKCLGKINEVAYQKNRTILFVSHNMETVLKICNRAVLLRSGEVQAIGNTDDVVSTYLRGELSTAKHVDLRNMWRDHEFPDRVRLVQLTAYPERSEWTFSFGEEIGITLALDARLPLDDAVIHIALYSARGFEVASWSSESEGLRLSMSSGRNVFNLLFKNMRLLPGQFYFNIGIRSSRGFEDHIPNAVTFEIHPSDKSAQINANEFRGAFLPNVKVIQIPKA